jgi:Ca2+/Na+ antiporter
MFKLENYAHALCLSLGILCVVVFAAIGFGRFWSAMLGIGVAVVCFIYLYISTERKSERDKSGKATDDPS